MNVLYEKQLPYKISLLTTKFYFLLLLFGFVVAYIKTLSHKTTITETRFSFEIGFLTKETEDIDMFRVLDVSVKQTFLGRMFNFGLVCIRSSDKSAPYFEFLIENPMEWKEKIWTLSKDKRSSMDIKLQEEF